MKKTWYRAFALCLCAVLTAGLLFGCSGESTSDDAEEKQTVSVGLWANQLLETYAPWLQEQFPDVEFDFYIVNNSTGYYNFRAAHDALPDILTVRRFALIDVEGIRDKLLDLSDTELVNQYYQSYLRSYTYSDGVVNWLPTTAEPEGVIVNKTLFEQYNIPLPTDYDSFVYACQAFAEYGIEGFAADFGEDYTCMNILQGLSADILSSTDGLQWRKEYESGTAPGLDEAVWTPIFERMAAMITDLGLDSSATERTATDIREAFNRGELAMYRGGTSDITSYGEDYEDVLLPYPGQTEEAGWLLTCPSFQVAASSRASESEEREALILEILTAMVSEEGLNHISSGKNSMAYAKDMDLELLPELSNLSAYVENNKIYIRIASSDFFSVSKNVVQRMLSGELDAESAYAEFNRQLTEGGTGTAETAVQIDTGYSHEFNPDSGNEAASAVYNTLRDELGVDLVIGQSAIVAGDILAGDYTEQEVAYIITWSSGPLVRMDLTGAQVRELVQLALDAKGTHDSVTNDSTLPAFSGFSAELSRTDEGGYKVESLSVDGEEMDENATYSVVLCVTYAPNQSVLQEAGFTDYTIMDGTIKSILRAHLLSGEQLAAPTAYITIQ